MVIKNGIALDTCIAIDILNGKNEIAKICFNFFPLYLPIIVCGELLYGAINSSKRLKNISKYQDFIDDCHILNTTSNISIEYAEIRKNLRDTGRPIPENDIWIAAICKSYDITLVTRDKHFNFIQNLKIILIE